MNKIKIALLQYSPIWEEPAKTIKTIDLLIEENDLSNVSLLIFPEMSLTGFTMNSQKFAEDMDGISFQYFMQLARRLKKDIFAGIIERDGKNIFNSLIHFDKKGLIKANYRKIHPFSFAKEDKYYSAGNEPFVTSINKITFGLSVCYDLRFPELYRFYGIKKTDVLINIANWPIARIRHWNLLLQARAIENQSYMIGVNRIGNDPYLEYSGYSTVVDSIGNILSQNLDVGITVIEIDAETSRKTKEKFPFLDDIKLIK
jgi:predicted amidohydrolase